MFNRDLRSIRLTFSRTLGEAFKDADYACSIERKAPQRSAVGWWIAASVVALLALSLIAGRG